MNDQPRPPLGPQPWETVRTKLDQSIPFANMRGTPYYRDAVYEQFSSQEYARRYAALRAKMRDAKLDCIIAAGGPSHWSFGGAMLWLTGHWEWHALAAYVLVPLEGEPTMIYSMGGTHAEAVRRQVAVAVEDVRHSRNGQYAQVMVERLRELKLERGRIGLMEIDPRHSDYMPVNQYQVLRDQLPDAELVFTKGFLHELLSINSAEELDCARNAGREGIRAARCVRRRHYGRRRRHRFPHHRLDPDGRPGADLRQSPPLRPRAEAGRHHQHGARRRLSRLHGADRLTHLSRAADRDGAEILGEDHAAGLSAHRRRDRARQAGGCDAAGEPLLPRGRRAVAPHPVPRHRSRHRQSARHRRAREGGTLRAGAQARHGDHGGAEPDHGGRHVRHLPRPHLHRHRDRPRDRGSIPAGDRGGLARCVRLLRLSSRPSAKRESRDPSTPDSVVVPPSFIRNTGVLGSRVCSASLRFAPCCAAPGMTAE